MVDTEIQQLCHDLAQEVDLPVSWVKLYVDRKAGRPCRSCKGWGRFGLKDCQRCGGSGGPRGTRREVDIAIQWIRSHTEHIRKQITRQQFKQTQQVGMDEFHVIEWKLEHHDLWMVLEDMLPCPFRDKVLQEILDGDVSEESMEALSRKAKKRQMPPEKGQQVEESVYILKMNVGIGPHGHYFRYDFESPKGWRGRFEMENDPCLSVLQTYVIQGKVVWSKDNYVILDISSISE